MAVLAMIIQVLVGFEVEAAVTCFWCCSGRLSEKNSGVDLGVQGFRGSTSPLTPHPKLLDRSGSLQISIDLFCLARD